MYIICGAFKIALRIQLNHLNWSLYCLIGLVVLVLKAIVISEKHRKAFNYKKKLMTIHFCPLFISIIVMQIRELIFCMCNMYIICSMFIYRLGVDRAACILKESESFARWMVFCLYFYEWEFWYTRSTYVISIWHHDGQINLDRTTYCHWRNIDAISITILPCKIHFWHILLKNMVQHKIESDQIQKQNEEKQNYRIYQAIFCSANEFFLRKRSFWHKR